MNIKTVAALFGGLGVLAGAAIAAELSGNPARASVPDSYSAPQSIDRYEIRYSPITASETYLLDTQTGRCWVFADDATTGETLLCPIPMGTQISSAPAAPTKP